jgi:hypothetical protein
VVMLAIAAWVASALLCYVFLRRVSYNLLDPLIVTHFFIPFIAALLTVLCGTDLVPWDQFPLFWVTLLAYLTGARVAGAFFGRETFRLLIADTLASLRRSELYAVLFITVTLTLVLGVLAVHYGAQGDERQGFAKLFRPLVVFQNGLFLLALIALLSPKLSLSSVVAWMLLLIVPSVAFSGKSVLVPVLFWFGLRLYLTQRVVTLRAIVGTLGVVLLGVAVMGVFAYKSSSAADLVYLLTNRIWMSGETYIYAYQWDAMASVRSVYHVSFIPYMLHPLTSLVGVRAYDKPLGGMLFAQLMGDDIVGGPNPLLPVLLDFFFPDSLMLPAVAALVIGVLVIGIRSFAIALRTCRSRYLKLGGIAAAVFCPSMGFLDTSLVLISLIGVAAATVFGVAAELLLSPRPESATRAIASAG